MRRADRALNREAALETLDRCVFGVLSLCAPDGTPYAVALNLVRDGDHLYFHCASEGLKVDLLRQNPKVCVLFVDNAAIDQAGLTTHYASALVRGTAREVVQIEEKRRALMLLCMRYAPEFAEKGNRCATESADHTGVWCVELESITGKQNAPKA